MIIKESYVSMVRFTIVYHSQGYPASVKTEDVLSVLNSSLENYRNDETTTLAIMSGMVAALASGNVTDISTCELTSNNKSIIDIDLCLISLSLKLILA